MLHHTTPLKYYTTHSHDLLARYDAADMRQLHQLLIRHLPAQADVMDIGFGSGRDLGFLAGEGFRIWGMDPTVAFVHNARKRFGNFPDHFITGQLPFTEPHENLKSRFDAVIVIAVWMHLNTAEYASAVEDVVSLLKADATVIISYCTRERAVDDGRCFEEVDPPLLNRLFESHGFALAERHCGADGLQRQEIEWVTVAYRR